MTSMSMAALIEKAQAQREREEAERVARKQERAQAIKAALAADLAALRALLGDEVEITLHSSKTDSNGEVYDTGYDIRPKAWHGMASFSAEHWRSSDPWTFKYYRVSGACVQLKLPFPPGNVWALPEVIEMIADLQATYEKARDSRIAVAMEWLDGNTSELIAADAYETLMTLAPERAAEWDAARAAWQARRDEREEAVDAYVVALTAWRARYEKALAENRATVAESQRVLDEEFTRYEIGLAVFYTDDDGRAYPARVNVWSLDSKTDEHGYWRVLDNGRVERRVLVNVLWVGEAVTETLMAAGDGPWRETINVYEAGQPLYCLPWAASVARQDTHRLMRSLPAEPEPPEWVRDGLTAAERERINEVTRGMGRVDIPF